MNVGSECTTRGFLQFLLRLRRYVLGHQCAHFLISRSEQGKFVRNAEDIQALFTQLENKEADAVQGQTNISFQDQITGTLKWNAIKELLGNTLACEDVSKLFDQYKSILITKKEEEDDEAIRIPESNIDTLKILKKQHAEAFKIAPEQCKDERKKVLAKAAKNPYFSKKTSSSPGLMGSQADHQIQVQQQQEQQTQNQNLLEIQTQMQRLIRQHKGGNWHRTHKDIDWTPNWQGGPLPREAQQTTVSEFLKAKLASGSTEQFAPCFPSNLSLTANLRYTSDVDISVMHPRFKKTHAMLIIQDKQTKQLQATLLSKYDFPRVKERLQKNPASRTWLVNLQGFEELHTQAAGSLPDTDEVKELIWHANLFNGNTTYLLDHMDLTRKIAHANRGEVADQMGDYLLLKNLATTSGIEQVFQTGLASKERCRNWAASSSRVICADRRKLNTQLLRPLDQLSDDEVRNIDPTFVGLLPDNKLHLLDDAVRIGSLGNRQLQLIELKQLHWVKNERLKQLTNPTLIQSLVDPAKIQSLGTGSKQLEYVTAEQIPHLTDKQLFNLPEALRQYLSNAEKERIRNYILAKGKYLSTKPRKWPEEYFPAQPPVPPPTPLISPPQPKLVEEIIFSPPEKVEEPSVQQLSELVEEPVSLEPVREVGEDSEPVREVDEGSEPVREVDEEVEDIPPVAALELEEDPVSQLFEPVEDLVSSEPVREVGEGLQNQSGKLMKK